MFRSTLGGKAVAAWSAVAMAPIVGSMTHPHPRCSMGFQGVPFVVITGVRKQVPRQSRGQNSR